MDCIETTLSTFKFLSTLDIGDMLVLCPMHVIPGHSWGVSLVDTTPTSLTENLPRKMKKRTVPNPDEPAMFRGDSPIFVEVQIMTILPNDSYQLVLTPITSTPGIRTFIRLQMNYIEATDVWNYHITVSGIVTEDIETETHYTRIPDATIRLPSRSLKISKMQDFCISVEDRHTYYTQRAETRKTFTREVLPDCLRHTERALMREILAKKICDMRAADVIAREFYPFL